MKYAIRFFRKNKGYASINLFGLTLGLTISIFIFLYVQDELSYDKYLPGYDRVVRIQPVTKGSKGTQEWATTEGFLIPTLSPMYPEIEASTRILRLDAGMIFKKDSSQFLQEGVIGVDSSFFKVFPFSFLYGDASSALNKIDAVVITRKVATKFFGNANPIGKLLNTDNTSYEVTGVIEDLPSNSHFNFDVVVLVKKWWEDADQSRNAYAFYSYVRLQTAGQVPDFQKVLETWYMKHGFANQRDASVEILLKGVPISDIHLQSHAEKEFLPNGQLNLVYIFIVVAIMIMVIATINYINLSNAMAIRRAKEVAVRKTIGASRNRLFLNFLLESYGFSAVAFLLSMALVFIFIPQFNFISGKQFDFSVLLDSRFLLMLVCAWLILGFMAGLYPATILSSFNPIQAMKSATASGRSSTFTLYLRRGLIVFQFIISSLLIVSAITVGSQLDFIGSRDAGFNKNNVIVVPIAGSMRGEFQRIKEEIERLSSVESVSFTSVIPGKRVVYLSVKVPDLAGTQNDVDGGDDGSRTMRVMAVDHDFVKTMGLQVIDGRDFSDADSSDFKGGFILNETAVRSFNLQDPVGRRFEYVYNDNKPGKVVGVVKDFNFASVHSKVEPLMMMIYPWMYSSMCVRLNTGNVPSAINDLETAWGKLTSVPFAYQFLDTTYDAMYKTERTTGKVISLFTGLALIIAGLGLFGIVSFFVIQRTREVGVRKVFGATHFSIFRVLSREYLVIVVVANLIALYPAWVLSERWLQQFAYRVELTAMPFVVALLGSEILALISIAYVINKISRVNPAIVLRQEG